MPYQAGLRRLGRLPSSTQALLGPHQVIDLLGGGFTHFLAHRWQSRGQRLSLVQGLGTDLARVIHAHQAGDVAAAALVEVASRCPSAGDGRPAVLPRLVSVRITVSTSPIRRSTRVSLRVMD
jgi:hypothetical protein